MAGRMAEVPNPYQDYAESLPSSLRDELPKIARAAEPPAETRYFEMEDSGDWMGFNLSRLVRAGLQVEFTGYAEDPKQFRRMTNMKWDPYHPSYLLTTAGLLIRF